MTQNQAPTPMEQPAMVASGNRSISIGLPACCDPFERRFPLTPESVNRLVESGFVVKVQSGAANVIHYNDNQYQSRGATIVERDEALKCDVVIHLAPLSAVEVKRMRRGAMLLSMLQNGSQPRETITALTDNHITAIAIDLVQDEEGNHPFADTLAEIDGRAAMSVASALLANSQVGKGILLGGVAGVVPCEVTIIGSGIAACAAARSAIGLGAMVRMFDNDVYRLRRAMRELGPMVIGSALHPNVLHNALRSADIIVATPMRNGYKLSSEEVSLMKQRAIVFDLKNEGSNAPSIALGSHNLAMGSTQDNIGEGRLCFVNVGQTVPHTAAMALSNAMVTLLSDMVGVERCMISTNLQKGVQSGAYVYMGKVVNKKIAHQCGLRYVDISLLSQLS